LLYAQNQGKIGLPSTVVSIATGALAFQDKIGEIDFSKVTDHLTLNERSLSYAPSLEKIDWPSDGNTAISIGSGTFKNDVALPSIALPSNAEVLGSAISVFERCVSLEKIDLSACKMTEIGSYFCENCPVLNSVVLPTGLTKIDNYVFYDCPALASISLPSTLTSIGTYAFAHDAALTSIVIPSAVTSISRYAFGGCSSLKAIYLEATTLPTTNFESNWNGNAPYYLYSEATPSSNPDSYWHYVNNVPTVYPAA
jgi:hypothetical protein